MRDKRAAIRFEARGRADGPSDDVLRNPLYEYLLGLQHKRVHLVDTLAPGRHLAMQLWIGAGFVVLWIADLAAPGLAGLPMAILILVGPFVLMAGPFLAGWEAQLLAVRNYPSPLDSPRALELLLTTPLTEREIVAATVGAVARYPFIGWRIGRPVPILASLLVFLASIAGAWLLRRLPADVLLMSLDLYLPAFCVFLFFPLLSALDLLLVPAGWLRRGPDQPIAAGETVWGRSGRLPVVAMGCALVPVVIRVNQLGPLKITTVQWVLTTACPIIIVCLTAATGLIMSFLPRHLARLRRGE
jgi:hypothetical protein